MFTVDCRLELKEHLHSDLVHIRCCVGSYQQTPYPDLDPNFAELDQNFADLDQHFADLDQNFADLGQNFTKLDQNFTDWTREALEFKYEL